MTLTITVLGEPVPQGSMKSLGPRRMVHSNAERLRPWRDTVAWHMREEMNAAGMTEPWDVPVVVTATFVLPRPASAPRRRWAPDRKPDIDKLLRAALDALTASGVIADDARVVHVEMSKVYGQPSMVLTVGPAPEPVPMCCIYERQGKPQDGYCRLHCPGFTPGMGGAA